MTKPGGASHRWAMRTLVVALAVAAPALSAAPALPVIPRPLAVTLSNGPAVRIVAGTSIVSVPGDAEAAAVAAYLAGLVMRTEHLRLVPAARAVAADETAIVLRRTPQRTDTDSPDSKSAESYTIDVGARRVTISASTRAGLFYGAVTVWQLLSGHDAKAGPLSLAAMHIVDAPRFAWRGLLLDSARHYQSPAFIERMLDWMALHKLNTLQWHLTDDQGWRLEIAKYPRLTSVGGWRTAPDGSRYGGYYTQVQVRHLVAYAATRNITIVPEIEMPGHALAAIRAYPQLGFAGVPASAEADWGVFPSIYSPDEATFGFFDDVLGEVMALFPSRFIAVGGDEAVKDSWHGSPAVQARIKALGLADETALQGYFVRRIGTFLNAHGRRLIGWDDILQGGDLPASDAVLSWHGSDGAVAAARAGHDVVMATAPTLYFDNRQTALPGEPAGRGVVISLRDVYAFDPGNPPLPAVASNTGAASQVLTVAEQRHIIGLQGNLWSEHIASEAQMEAMALPRAAAVAESGWTSAANRDWPGFAARLPAQFTRYRALGLNADTGAFAVDATVRPVAGDAARVRLSSQLDTDIHYTIDGSAPSPASPRYAAPFETALPARLRAVTGRRSGGRARTRPATGRRQRPPPGQSAARTVQRARPAQSARQGERRRHCPGNPRRHHEPVLDLSPRRSGRRAQYKSRRGSAAVQLSARRRAEDHRAAPAVDPGGRARGASGRLRRPGIGGTAARRRGARRHRHGAGRSGRAAGRSDRPVPGIHRAAGRPAVGAGVGSAQPRAALIDPAGQARG